MLKFTQFCYFELFFFKTMYHFDTIMYDYWKQSRMNTDYESYRIIIQLVLVIINRTIKKTCKKYQIAE